MRPTWPPRSLGYERRGRADSSILDSGARGERHQARVDLMVGRFEDQAGDEPRAGAASRRLRGSSRPDRPGCAEVHGSTGPRAGASAESGELIQRTMMLKEATNDLHRNRGEPTPSATEVLPRGIAEQVVPEPLDDLRVLD